MLYRMSNETGNISLQRLYLLNYSVLSIEAHHMLWQQYVPTDYAASYNEGNRGLIKPPEGLPDTFWSHGIQSQDSNTST